MTFGKTSTADTYLCIRHEKSIASSCCNGGNPLTVKGSVCFRTVESMKYFTALCILALNEGVARQLNVNPHDFLKY